MIEDQVQVILGLPGPAIFQRNHHPDHPGDDVPGIEGEHLVELSGRDRQGIRLACGLGLGPQGHSPLDRLVPEQADSGPANRAGEQDPGVELIAIDLLGLRQRMAGTGSKLRRRIQIEREARG